MFETKVDKDKLRGRKIEIYPTEAQKKYINRQIELARFVYNWCIDVQEAHIEETNLYYRFVDLYNEFRKFYNNEDNSWIKEIPLHTAMMTVRHVITAYDNYFSKRTQKPKYKSRKYSKQSFEVRNEPNAFYFRGTKLRISGLPFGDMIECKNHNVPYGEGIYYYRCTITFDGYRYWLSLNIEVNKSHLMDDPDIVRSDESIGIDVGIRTAAQLSNGKSYTLPDMHTYIKRRNRTRSRIDKMVSARTKRSKEGAIAPPSKNEQKLRYINYKARRRIANIKNNFVHQTTTEIANTYPRRVVMEDLPITELKSRHYFAKRNNGVMYELRIKMEYKCRDRGIEFVLADRHFPSSQICSRCGNQKHELGSEKIYKCKCCGLEIDRDVNAAINLSRYTVA